MSPSKDQSGSTPKIAIKGFSLSSKSSSKPPSKPGLASSKQNSNLKPTLSSSLGKRSRSGFAHHEDSDSEEERHEVKHEAVTGFGADGAIKHERDEKRHQGPLVIKKLENKDWKSEARKRQGGGKNLLPPEVLAAREKAARIEAEGGINGKMEGVDVVNSTDAEPQWGLSVTKRPKTEAVLVPAPEDGETRKNTGQIDMQEKDVEEDRPLLTADEEALQALLGNKKEVKRPDMVIEIVRERSASPPQISETDAYKRAIASAPEVSTLEDYERVPVEEFGAALLRGMGWKGEKVGGAKEIKRRQNLLGLGAKELQGAEELGAWVQKSDVKRLNPGSSRGGGGSGYGGGGDRRPKASEYRREKEKRDERREERGGGSYRREKERERDSYRERDRERDRDRDRRR